MIETTDKDAQQIVKFYEKQIKGMERREIESHRGGFWCGACYGVCAGFGLVVIFMAVTDILFGY